MEIAKTRSRRPLAIGKPTPYLIPSSLDCLGIQVGQHHIVMNLDEIADLLRGWKKLNEQSPSDDILPLTF